MRNKSSSNACGNSSPVLKHGNPCTLLLNIPIPASQTASSVHYKDRRQKRQGLLDLTLPHSRLIVFIERAQCSLACQQGRKDGIAHAGGGIDQVERQKAP